MRLLPIAALIAATIALPSVAHGATLERYSGIPGTMQLTAGAAETNLITVEDRALLDLGDGNDVATVASRRPVSISGGAGNDRYTTEGVRVGVDGMPFDGRPGDNDRIDRTVETVLGSQFDDVLTGTQRDQQLFGFEGDDAIAGGPGQDVLDGGRGQDRINARDGELDAIDCGGELFDQRTADPVESSILGCA